MEHHLIILKSVAPDNKDNPSYTLFNIYPAATHRASSLVANGMLIAEPAMRNHTVLGYHAVNGDTQFGRELLAMQTLTTAVEVLPFHPIGEHQPHLLQ